MRIKVQGLQVDPELGGLGVLNATDAADASIPLEVTLVAGPEYGTPAYDAGTGTATISLNPGERLVALTLTAPEATAASFTINGGDVVTVPADREFTWSPRGSWDGVDIVISGSESYFVEWVT